MANRRQPKKVLAEVRAQKVMGEDAPTWLDDQTARQLAASPATGPSGYWTTGYGGGTGTNQYPAEIDSTRPDPDTPPMDERGATGTAVFGGIITSEEYNPDFYWREAVRIYEQMRRNDYQIFSSLLMCELPIMRADWKVEPASDSPDDIDIASHTETALFHELEMPFTDVIRNALLKLSFGFSINEKVFKIADDGSVFWSKFAPRLPRTIWRWWIDSSNELRGVQQWTYKNYNYEFIEIAAEKLMVFTNRLEGGNFEGVSVLRTAYKPWFYKEGLLRIMAIGFEREHVGVPVIQLPNGHTAADLARAQNIGKNLRSNESAYVTLPFGWTLDWLHGQAGGRSSSHTPILDAIALMDVAISRNVLAQMQNLGSGETGSYALADVQNDFFLMSLQAIANEIAEGFNGKSNGAIPQLVRYNFGPQLMYPKLVCSRIQSFDGATLANALANLARFGVITPDQGLEDFARDMYGIPSAPHNPVEALPGMGTVDQSGAPGGQQDPMGGQRSTGNTGGAGAQIAMSVPAEYRTDRFLYEMPHHQAVLYSRMVQRAIRGRRAYQLSETPSVDVEDFSGKRARKVPDDPDYVARKDATARRLLRNYKKVEEELKQIAGETEPSGEPGDAEPGSTGVKEPKKK